MRTGERHGRPSLGRIGRTVARGRLQTLPIRRPPAIRLLKAARRHCDRWRSPLATPLAGRLWSTAPGMPADAPVPKKSRGGCVGFATFCVCIGALHQAAFSPQTLNVLRDAMPCIHCGHLLFNELNDQHWKHVFGNQLLDALRCAAETIHAPRNFDAYWMDRYKPAVRVINCILSINRRTTFAEARSLEFQTANPNVVSITDLQATLSAYPTPHHFMRTNLNYNYEARANTLSAVVNWLVSNVSGNGSPQQQLNNLTNWAQTANPGGYLVLQIPGLGLATFQYLRMMFYACTVKPDVHILNFVRQHDASANGVRAINVVEKLAAGLGLCARHLDLAIWEDRWARHSGSGCSPGS